MEARIDGRSARRERNRTAVVDAVIALLGEGVLAPTPELVCRRAGVSERSLFRYFDSLDELRGAVVERAFRRIEPFLAVADPARVDLAERITRLVRDRIAMYDALGDVARVARAREFDTPEIACHLKELRKRLRAQVADQFAPEFAALERAAARRRTTLVAALLSFSSFDFHTRVQASSRAEVRRSWIEGLEVLLAGPPGRAPGRSGAGRARPQASTTRR